METAFADNFKNFAEAKLKIAFSSFQNVVVCEMNRGNKSASWNDKLDSKSYDIYTIGQTP